MKKFSISTWMLIALFLLSTISGLSLAQESPSASGSPLRQGRTNDSPIIGADQQPEKVAENGQGARFNSALPQFQLTIAQVNYKNEPGDEACYQLLANTQLNVVEFGDGEGTAEPWVILDPLVYFDTVSYVSPDYSLFLQDGDPDDPHLFQDAFAQGFFMPDNLTYVLIEYETATRNTNNSDEAHANIFPIREDGTLKTDELLESWQINNSDELWQGRFVEILDQQLLQQMQDRPLALIFFSLTDESSPYERVYFDDITVIACVESAPPPKNGTVFLPSIMNKFGKSSGPICRPPTENPQDEYNKNRGLVQTGATCKSTLSTIDRADYYAFTPNKDGDHTLRLTNLPPNTEWAAMMFHDTPSPSYVEGPTDKQCRIGTPGAGDKSVTCDLKKGSPIIVKVSAGSTPTDTIEEYTMRITRP